jgi:hypothetical protein
LQTVQQSEFPKASTPEGVAERAVSGHIIIREFPFFSTKISSKTPLSANEPFTGKDKLS